MKVLSHPAHGESKSCIVDNWTGFQFVEDVLHFFSMCETEKNQAAKQMFSCANQILQKSQEFLSTKTLCVVTNEFWDLECRITVHHRVSPNQPKHTFSGC